MSEQRKWKNFKTDVPSSVTANSGKKFHNPQSSDMGFKKHGQTNASTGVDPKSKSIKKPKNKLSLNKFHQPIFKKVNEKKQLKKKARDLQRLIDKEDVSEEVKESKQKELQEVNEKIEKKEKQQKRDDRKIKFLESKYKSIKDVEMKKVRRAMDKCRKSLLDDTKDESEKQQLQKEEKELQNKFNYIKHFPQDKKYLSLFPKVEDEKMIILRTKIMKEILQRIEQKKTYLNKVEIDPTTDQQKELEKAEKEKAITKKLKNKKNSGEEVEQQMEIEEETQKMPKLTQKIVDNFFVPENSQIDNTKAKVIGRDGKVVSTNENPTNKKFKSFK